MRGLAPPSRSGNNTNNPATVNGGNSAAVPKIADSKSLHNYTLSPGWTKEEVEILKIALMKFGIGRWKKIKNFGCLPSKSIAQMNLQTQRLMGQQSLAEFMGLHVRLEKVFNDNLKKIGPEIQRKNNFIINTGDNQTAKERDLRIKLNKQKYGLTAAEIKALKVPKLTRVGGDKSSKNAVVLTLEQIFNEKSKFSVVEKIEHLERLQATLEVKLRAIEKKKRLTHLKKMFRPFRKLIVVRRTEDGGYEYEDTIDEKVGDME